MRCVVCKKPISIETSFENLLTFHFVCEECQLIEQTKPLLESIPINGGMIHWLTLCPTLSPSQIYENQYSHLYAKGFRFFQEQPKSTSIFLILEFAEIEHFPTWSMILFLEENVYIVSLFTHVFPSSMME